MRIDVMGVGFDNVTIDEAAERARALLAQPGPAVCVTPNSEIVYESLTNSDLRDALNDAELVLPDGSGIVLGAKLLHTPLKQKVAGVDFADRLLGILSETGQTLYLLGSKPGIGELAAKKMVEKHPGLQIAGIADGYFKDENAAIAIINEAKPDVLFVCLGAPKQEFFMRAHRGDIHTHLMIGLGGSLDSFAGTVKRAPRWMIRLNLEWFYRLIKQPSRIGRMMRLPKFVFAVLRKRHGG